MSKSLVLYSPICVKKEKNSDMNARMWEGDIIVANIYKIYVMW